MEASEKVLADTRNALLPVTGGEPKLSNRLLARPPYGFLSAIITSVRKHTGFGEGLLSEVETSATRTRDKLNVLAKTIICVVHATKEPIDSVVSPLKIVAGQEPALTCWFLRQLAAASVLGPDVSRQAVEHARVVDLSIWYRDTVRRRRALDKCAAIIKGHVCRRRKARAMALANTMTFAAVRAGYDDAPKAPLPAQQRACNTSLPSLAAKDEELSKRERRLQRTANLLKKQEARMKRETQEEKKRLFRQMHEERRQIEDMKHELLKAKAKMAVKNDKSGTRAKQQLHAEAGCSKQERKVGKRSRSREATHKDVEGEDDKKVKEWLKMYEEGFTRAYGIQAPVSSMPLPLSSPTVPASPVVPVWPERPELPAIASFNSHLPASSGWALEASDAGGGCHGKSMPEQAQPCASGDLDYERFWSFVSARGRDKEKGPDRQLPKLEEKPETLPNTQRRHRLTKKLRRRPAGVNTEEAFMALGVLEDRLRRGHTRLQDCLQRRSSITLRDLQAALTATGELSQEQVSVICDHMRTKSPSEGGGINIQDMAKDMRRGYHANKDRFAQRKSFHHTGSSTSCTTSAMDRVMGPQTDWLKSFDARLDEAMREMERVQTSSVP